MTEREAKSVDLTVDLTKQLVALALAIITLTVTVTLSQKPQVEGGALKFLGAAWVVYLLSIICGGFAFWHVDALIRNPKQYLETPKLGQTLLYRFRSGQFILFVVGTALMVVSGYLYLR